MSDESDQGAAEPNAPVLPTGEQHKIRRGTHEAVITEVGATLREYTVGDNNVIDPFRAGEMSDSHGQTLIPWPNRIAGATYEFDNNSYLLPVNQPSDDAAIHGLVRFLPWDVVKASDDEITLANTLWPTPGYPFALYSQAAFTLTGTGLSVAYKVTNIGSGSLPVGVGTHPYFTVGTPTVDEALLTVPAETMLLTDDNGIPTGTAPVAGTKFDFRSPRPIGETVLDIAYTDLIPGSDGKVRVTLAAPDGSRVVNVQLDTADGYTQIYSSDTLPDPATHRKSLAIEPMTCPANAFNSGEGLVVLKPGKSFASGWEVLPEPNG